MNSEWDERMRRRKDAEEQAVAIAYHHGFSLESLKELMENYQCISLPREGESMIARSRGSALRPYIEKLLAVIHDLRQMHISHDTLAAVLDIDNADDVVAIDTAYKVLLSKAAAPLTSETVDPRRKLITCMMASAANLWLNEADERFTCDFVVDDGELAPVDGSAIQFIMYCITRVHEVWPEEIQACVPDMERSIGEDFLKEHRAIWDEPEEADEPPKLRIVK